MSKFISIFRRKSFLIACAIVVIAISGATFLIKSSILEQSSKPSVIVVPKAIVCFDFKIGILIEATVDYGCPSYATSLGDGAIPAPSVQASSLNPLLRTRFRAAQMVAKKENMKLEITSGFRSLELQAKLFADEIKLKGSEEEASKWVLPPQYSHHPMGTAIDVNYNYDKDSTLWLETNGYKFGLCRVYKNEWWHFEGAAAPGVKCPPMKLNALADVNPSPSSSPTGK